MCIHTENENWKIIFKSESLNSNHKNNEHNIYIMNYYIVNIILDVQDMHCM